MSDLGFHHVYQPPKNDSQRTLLLLHGTGGDEHDLLPLGPLVDPDAGILSPRGKTLENGMPRFFRRLAEGVFDEVDLRFRTAELAQFVADAATEYGFDPRTVYAVGYSNGANIAASLLLISPTTLAGGALLHGMVPLMPEQAPELTGRKVLLTAGENDPLIPPDLTRKLGQMLIEYGAEVSAAWFQSGHSLSQGEVSVVADWFRKL